MIILSTLVLVYLTYFTISVQVDKGADDDWKHQSEENFERSSSSAIDFAKLADAFEVCANVAILALAAFVTAVGVVDNTDTVEVLFAVLAQVALLSAFGRAVVLVESCLAATPARGAGEVWSPAVLGYVARVIQLWPWPASCGVVG